MFRGLFLTMIALLPISSVHAQQRENMADRLKRYDKNGDGKVTKAEFSGPARAFSRFDADGDGVITSKEMGGASGGSRASGAKTSRSSGNVIGELSMAERMAEYQAFPTEKPAPGDNAPKFELKDLSGKTVSLNELLATAPVVIETGSCTCPVFRRSHGKIEELQQQFGKRVHFVVLYGREAHAGSGAYKDTPPPTTLEERVRLAEKVAREISIGLPVAVDDIDNKVSLAYGGLANAGYIIGQDGRVFYKMPWIDARLLSEPLTALLKSGGRGGAHPPKFPNGQTMPGGGGRRTARSGSRASSKGVSASSTPVKVPAGMENDIVWASNFSDALKLAKKSNSEVLVKFHFKGCPICFGMDQGPLRDKRVVDKSRQFVGVKVDITTDDGEKLADKFEVVGTPVFVRLNPDGEEVDRHNGPAGVATFLGFLDDRE